MVTIRIEHEHRIAARQRLSLRLNPLLCAGGSWFSTRGRALLGLQVGQPLCTGQAQQVWKNASLPWFGRLGCPELGRRNRLALWALCHDPEPSRALRRTGCGGIQPAKNRMGFAQGCFLSRTANLEGLTSVFEEEILGQRFRSGPIRDGRNGFSDAHRFVAGLDLDRERPCLASHARFAMLMEDRSSPDWVGSMILRRQAAQTCPPTCRARTSCGSVLFYGEAKLPQEAEVKGRVTFGRTRTLQGGPASLTETEVRLDGTPAGRIVRRANPKVAGSMEYQVHIEGEPSTSVTTLASARALARDFLLKRAGS
jgi:hypothetical protein